MDSYWITDLAMFLCRQILWDHRSNQHLRRQIRPERRSSNIFCHGRQWDPISYREFSRGIRRIKNPSLVSTKMPACSMFALSSVPIFDVTTLPGILEYFRSDPARGKTWLVFQNTESFPQSSGCKCVYRTVIASFGGVNRLAFRPKHWVGCCFHVSSRVPVTAGFNLTKDFGLKVWCMKR